MQTKLVEEALRERLLASAAVGRAEATGGAARTNTQLLATLRDRLGSPNPSMPMLFLSNSPAPNLRPLPVENEVKADGEFASDGTSESFSEGCFGLLESGKLSLGPCSEPGDDGRGDAGAGAGAGRLLGHRHRQPRSRRREQDAARRGGRLFPPLLFPSLASSFYLWSPAGVAETVGETGHGGTGSVTGSGNTFVESDPLQQKVFLSLRSQCLANVSRGCEGGECARGALPRLGRLPLLGKLPRRPRRRHQSLFPSVLSRLHTCFDAEMMP